MATYQKATGKTIDAAFEIYHQQNPKVYELFKKYVNDILSRGKKLTSAKMIINRIRWEIYMETKGNEEYRINDAFTSRYARLYAKEYPHYKDIFNFRDLRS